jgi:hypothetical protein
LLGGLALRLLDRGHVAFVGICTVTPTIAPVSAC